ncbi:hypothetical protein C2E15_08900 [Mixta gaviniae]|uniref:Secreted protein n=1 Tax=Mixta gaviniae TaxID=665914 RepID=A0A2L0IFM0_9GAMM|nr:hypothetical protein C2E15_08900 [Mixta gaviniae]
MARRFHTIFSGLFLLARAACGGDSCCFPFSQAGVLSLPLGLFHTAHRPVFYLCRWAYFAPRTGRCFTSAVGLISRRAQASILPLPLSLFHAAHRPVFYLCRWAYFTLLTGRVIFIRHGKNTL